MLENPAALFMEIRFPHDKFIHGKIFLRNPLPRTPPPPAQKSPPENVCTLPNNY